MDPRDAPKEFPNDLALCRIGQPRRHMDISERREPSLQRRSREIRRRGQIQSDVVRASGQFTAESLVLPNIRRIRLPCSSRLRRVDVEFKQATPTDKPNRWLQLIARNKVTQPPGIAGLGLNLDHFLPISPAIRIWAKIER